MDDLVSRLLEAIAETEQDAQACGGAPWIDAVTGMVHVDPVAIREDKWGLGHLGFVASADNSPIGDAYRKHIARHDPASVLRRCAADGRLVELHDRMSIHPGHPYFNDEHLTREPMVLCKSCEPERMWRRERSWPCRTLLTLAEGYGISDTELDVPGE